MSELPEPALITAHEYTPVPIRGAEVAPPVSAPFGSKPESPRSDRRAPRPEPAFAAPARVERGFFFPAVQVTPIEPSAGPRTEVRHGRYVDIVATLNLTRNTGKMRYVHHVQRAQVTLTDDRRALVRLIGVENKPLGEYPVAVREDSDIPANEDRTAVIDAVVPDLPSVTAVELLLNGKVIDRIEVAKRSPSVSALHLSSSNVLTWKGIHPESRPLTYLVQISFDDGKTWETLALSHPANSLALSPQQTRGHREFSLRVTANDGFNDSTPAILEIGDTNKELRDQTR